MDKNTHELRDPIHVFIKFDSAEREVLDSTAVQRLRHIHQLAMSYLVYPGATHKRFEHSLGVMELASRIFEIVSKHENGNDDIREQLPPLSKPDELQYWKRVLRMAALCHDIGHLPFSHAAEKDLLPPGYSHEQITREIILSDDMRKQWDSMIPPLRADHIAKIAIGPKEAKGTKFTTWETILSEIIVGDIFGADRMDYLLRDSHHSGVAYGRFDHYRLIDTLRILPTPESGEAALGVEKGGIQSAEALLWARYLMYSQVYFHSVRRIYDIHLKDFLKEWLPGSVFSTNLDDHLRMTDNEVMSALLNASRNSSSPGHQAALRTVNHDHFKCFYRRHPEDTRKNPQAARLIYEAAVAKFGVENVRSDSYSQKGGILDFPVKMEDSTVVSSLMVSDILSKIPLVAVDYVYIIPNKRDEAKKWIDANRSAILDNKEKEQ